MTVKRQSKVWVTKLFSLRFRIRDLLTALCFPFHHFCSKAIATFLNAKAGGAAVCPT